MIDWSIDMPQQRFEDVTLIGTGMLHAQKGVVIHVEHCMKYA
jgi:hypothetical protein